ncbi:peptidoglycan-binding domain-containing protein [Streptomyces sp. NRRL B-24484]|uniref:peptidoglycan-binding domain-containing protein n=1 Tax=Streptomyces sp. NRRL B-24484 TaxID=1463833 RepID=UPI0004C1F8B0|nr:peptidoglycan-binding domain-containing protein [Streptomyces sp. NRRL B-24484]
MPGELCPLCGTVRTAVGCACASSSPDVTDTAVLPHMEGPPLVRPYVAAGGGHGRPYPGPGPDPFATTLLPPAPPAARPAAPPPPSAPPAVPPQRPAPGAGPAAAGGGDLGVFDFHGTPRQRPGGRAERRESAQLVAGRRRTAVIAAGLGIAVVGAGLALALSPSSDKPNLDQALPVPSGTADVAPPDTGQPEPSTTASASAGRTSSASPTRTARATASRAPAAALSPAGSAPASASAAPPVAPSTSATARVLKPGDSGTDVRAMQQMLITVSCGDLNVWFATGTFDSWTQWILSEFQRDARIKGDERNGTQYGPKTRAALEKASADPNC